MENKCAALCYPHWNTHRSRVIHHVLVLSFGCLRFTFCRKDGGVGGGGGSQANSSLSVKETPDVFVRGKAKKKQKQNSLTP